MSSLLRKSQATLPEHLSKYSSHRHEACFPTNVEQVGGAELVAVACLLSKLTFQALSDKGLWKPLLLDPKIFRRAGHERRPFACG